MKILDRWRVAKMRRELAVVLSEDSKERAGETTADLMNRMCARAEQIALLRFNIRRIEGDDVDIDPEDPDDTRIPSGLFCPTTKPEVRS